MIFHYIKFAFRSLFRDKVFSLINILGLTIGLTGTFVVSIYLINELSFDNFHKNRDRIYRINNENLNSESPMARCPPFAATTFQDKFPEIEESMVVFYDWTNIKIGENKFSEQIILADNNYFQIFDFPIISGNKVNPLKNLSDIVITESKAIKLFGSTDVIGNTFNAKLDGLDKQLKVSAIIQDIPWNSSIRNEIIGNNEICRDTANSFINLRHDYRSSVFLLLKDEADETLLQQKIDEYKSASMPENFDQKYHLQSIKDFHLHSSHVIRNLDLRGDIKYLRIFFIIGILILFISASNFIILSTAKAINRTREISLRKIIGASGKSIMKQIRWESGILCFLVVPLGILLGIFTLPYASIIFDSKIGIYKSNIPYYLTSIITVLLFLFWFSGTYISFYTNRFKPLDAFRGSLATRQKFIGRKILIVAQLFILIALTTCVLSVQKQINFSKTKEHGFTMKNLYIIRTPQSDYANKTAFLNELLTNPAIHSAGYAGFGPPTFAQPNNAMTIDNGQQKALLQVLLVDFDFIETLEFKITEGRAFERNSTDKPNSVCIINESVVKEYNLTNPIGRQIGNSKVIGVIKDFHLQPTTFPIKPMLILLHGHGNNHLYLRIPDEQIDNVSAHIEKAWKNFYPNKTLSINSFFTLQDFAYQDYSAFAKNLTIFSALAIFLSIMGLFGLTLFTIEKRSKEIGIRKIHGASINNIMMMINKEFAVLVIIATILAWPVAWYFMDKWLQSFAYTIDFPYELYILSGLAAMIIVLLTVSIRFLKAAMSNPVDAIRNE